MWLTDIDSMMHLLMLIIAVYGTLLFLYWWAKQGTASAVFIYITLLFAGEATSACLEAYAESLRFTSIMYEDHFREQSWWWKLRAVPEMIAFAAIACHMSYRLFVEKIASERRKWHDRRQEQINRRNNRDDRRQSRRL